MCVALLGGASSAWAGTALSVPPDIPDPNGGVVVGQTNLPASLTVQNGSTGAQNAQNVTVSNITIVPSCGTLVVSANCPVGNFDPGVFRLSTTGTGKAGTACATQTFTVVKLDAAMDKYQFVPLSPATNPVLGPSAAGGPLATCVITFTVDVLRVPLLDAQPTAGIQTGELGGADAISFDQVVGGGVGSNFTTVSPAAISIQTQVAPGSIALGGSFHDTATLAPTAGAAPPTGSIRFDVYNNTACTGTPTFTSTNSLNAAGTTATSNDFTPTVAGIYHVVASYAGDANYNAVTSRCDDAAEAVVVRAPAPPPVVCTPPPGPAPPGGMLCTTPPTVCTPPPGPAPPGGELCARGTAAIRGLTGCAGSPFRVVVTGRQIQNVVFTLDGRKIRTLTKPNIGTRFVLGVSPSRLRVGVHHVVARTTFRKQSGTKARTLRVTFSRCGRRAVSPAFTG
ncbi:MAG: hypothetical protein QOI42_639 [Frankiaceae bacterium]|nr:hypothetical protein [Frankiaceae bacterium]